MFTISFLRVKSFATFDKMTGPFQSLNCFRGILVRWFHDSTRTKLEFHVFSLEFKLTSRFFSLFKNLGLI